MRIRITAIIIITALLGAYFLAAPVPLQAANPGYCTKYTAQVKACAGDDCAVLFEYSANSILITTATSVDVNDRNAWVPVSHPLTNQQGFVRATQVKSCEIADWKLKPIVPAATGRAREIYQRGLALGNNPRAFSRIGDCNSVAQFFLGGFDEPGSYDLGPYAHLQATIDHFKGAFARRSVTSDRGFNVASMLSPIWSDPKQCNFDENPLQCEYRLNKASFALITFETTWGGDKLYEKYLRQILDYLIEQGVVPILGTKANNNEKGHRINAVIARLAEEYNIPLWNFWLAAQPLPAHGLLPDRFHLTFARNFFGDSQRMRYGWPVRNLTALQALDAVWRGVQ